MGSWPIWQAEGGWIFGVFKKQSGKGMVSNRLVRRVKGTSSFGGEVCERLILIRVSIGTNILNVISGYAPQVGRSIEEKEEFLLSLSKMVDEIGQEEFVMIGGDMNGHVGKK